VLRSDAAERDHRDEYAGGDHAVAEPDADGDPLTYFVNTAPAHGTISGTAPNVVYTPANGFIGADSLNSKAADGHPGSFSSNAAISITVTATVNHAPTATAQTVTTGQNAAKAIT